MEHALGATMTYEQFDAKYVLILIVMEHALGEADAFVNLEGMTSLNPYCNGTCSRSWGIRRSERRVRHES